MISCMPFSCRLHVRCHPLVQLGSLLGRPSGADVIGEAQHFRNRDRDHLGAAKPAAFLAIDIGDFSARCAFIDPLLNRIDLFVFELRHAAHGPG